MNDSGTTLRKRLQESRSAISPKDQAFAAQQLMDRLLPVFASLRVDRPNPLVCGYLPYGGEIDVRPTLDALRFDGWRTALPVIGPRATMTFVEWQPDDVLEANKYGIDEPNGHPLSSHDIDVVLLPGVGFDHHGARIGHGVGFYDRFLAPFALKPRPVRIGVAHHQQMVTLPTPEPWDVDMHVVVTDQVVADLR